MPPKRALLATSPNPKRVKVSTTQRRLDSFFHHSAKLEVIDVDDESPQTPSTSQTNSKAFNISIKPVQFTPPSYPSLADDPLTFSIVPSQWWTVSTPAPYSFLAHTLSTLSSTRSRIAIINTLTNTFRVLTILDPPSLLPAIYLLSNRLGPAFERAELGLGPAVITKALQSVSGLTPAALRKLYNTHGDAGDVAFHSKSSIRTLLPHPPLLIRSLYASLLQLTRQPSLKFKQAIVEKLLLAAKGEETRYLTRTLVGNLRVGAVGKTLIAGLARAMVLSRPLSTQDPPADSLYYAPPSLLSSVLPLLQKKKAPEEDPSRAQILEMEKEAEQLLRRIFSQHPNFSDIVPALLSHGLEGLEEQVGLKVGVPVEPTLGTPVRGLEEVYERLGDARWCAEYKYDGQRAQVHAWKEGKTTEIKIFSRHLEDMTSKWPEIISLVRSILVRKENELTSFILDAEIVAVDSQTGELRSFQELSNRAKKDDRMGVCLYLFDLMVLNGRVLLKESFRTRRMLLRDTFSPTSLTSESGLKGSSSSTPSSTSSSSIPKPSSLTSIPKPLSSTTVTPVTMVRLDHVSSCESEEGREAVEAFWESAVEGKCEGLMIKLLDHAEIMEDMTTSDRKKGAGPKRKPLPATYEPDKRTSAWLKLKKDYVTGLGDSLDLVPIGAWHGNGRKAAWWSPVLMALWDESEGKFVGVCKCMSGFSDAFYKDLSERYKVGTEKCSVNSLWDVETGSLRPDVYFCPSEVWEMKGADITLSPVSQAALGLVSPSRGLSLRFPRFIRLREDKDVHQASGPDFLAGLWKIQEERGRVKGGADEGELVDVELEDSALDSEEE